MKIQKKSRTYYALKNASFAMGCQIVYILVSFLCRTVFTYLLGTEYLGIQGLFSNILTLLSFVEMGMGSALVYMMYEPLYKGNIEKVNVCLKFYKKVYYWVAAIVAIIGVSIIPFLKFLEAPDVKESITLLYCMYLANTVLSYLYVYKKSILIADQKNYIVSVYTQVFNIIMNIGQIFILLFTHNYVLYLLIMIICTLMNNIICSKHAEKLYPYIRGKTGGEFDLEEKKKFKKDVKGLLLGKIAAASFQGTDNIFISGFLGIRFVGILSNYTLITTTINSLMNQIFNSITASVGNLGVEADAQGKKAVYNKLYFLNTVIYMYLCIGLSVLLQEFVTDLWFTKEYMLEPIVIFLLVFELYLRGEHYVTTTFRSATGNFSQLKAFFVCAGVLNLILDWVLVQWIGMPGIILATIIGRGICRYVDIYVLYRYEFKMGISNYLVNHSKFLLFYFINYAILYIFTLNVCMQNLVLDFIMKIFVITVEYIVAVFICFSRTTEFKYFKNIILKAIRKG